MVHPFRGDGLYPFLEVMPGLRSAVGTGAMKDIAHPTNVTRIFCLKTDGTCEMSSAEFDLKFGMLSFGSPAVYEIKTWRSGRVTAIREHPCGTASMTIDLESKAVTITSVPMLTSLSAAKRRRACGP
jgi:hypothetical protein